MTYNSTQRTITLIRHGQCLQDDNDPPLTDLGYQQAVHTATLFNDKNIETIHYSTLQRARQTTEIIAQQLPDATLIGYDSLWEGIPTIPPQFDKLFGEQARTNHDFQPDNVQATQTRLDDAYSKIFTPATHHDVHDLVICHGNVIRYLVCRAIGISIHGWVQLHPPANCSLTSIVIKPTLIREALDAGITLTVLSTFNEAWHIPEELRTFS